MNDKPSIITAMSIMPIVSGVLNIFAAITWTIIIVLGTFGIGLLCAPIFLVPFILGIFEILYGVRARNNQASNTTIIAILEICSILWLNIPSCIMGILLLIFSNDPQAKEYYAEHGMS